MAPRTWTAMAMLLVTLGPAAAACGGDSGTAPPADQTTVPAGTTTAVAPTTGAASTVPFAPQRPLPEGFPVFPGAVLMGDDSESDGGHRYLYGSDATASEICEFFGWDLFEFGFNYISADCEDPFGFLVEAGRGGAPLVTVAFTDAAGAGVTYTVLIDYEVWGGE